MPHFYAVIIGTEILNNRRQDKHFTFIRDLLSSHGHTLYANFIIKDDVNLLKNTFSMIHADADAVLFSFGGIGSTPDDLTRKIAADVFTGKSLTRHKKFEQDIIERFEEAAFPHRIHMADLPEGANLIQNPVNNMSGFELQHRYFFVPGFPQMAHPMIRSCIERFFPNAQKSYRKTFIADVSENRLIHLMNALPQEIELSSLPMLTSGKAQVELSLSYTEETLLESEFAKFLTYLDENSISYRLL
jgi:molybdopterin-biosynthesis enzyme MoeA-like protein